MKVEIANLRPWSELTLDEKKARIAADCDAAIAEAEEKIREAEDEIEEAKEDFEERMQRLHTNPETP